MGVEVSAMPTRFGFIISLCIITLILYAYSSGGCNGNSLNRKQVQVPPYPPSHVIKSITWDFDHLIRKAPGSDLWPITWAADNNLYTSWGDGGGFGGTDWDGRVSLGFARIEGPPENFVGHNIWGGKNPDKPATFGGKVGAMLSVNGTLYARGGVWPGATGVHTNENSHEARLLWSSDLGKTWHYTNWTFADSDNPIFFPYGFLQFGKDYAGARDGFVYVYGALAWWIKKPSSDTYLVRVPKDQIRNRAAHEFFKGFDANGNPLWTSDINQRKPVFTDPNGSHITNVVYNPAIRRYIATGGRGQVGQLGIFDAPEPWGPWTTVAYYDDWGGFGTGESLGYSFPTKWISADGKTMWMVFSRLDSFNLIKAILTTSNKCVREEI
jgi:Domain of unknown function (DUF4185)